MTDRGGRPVDDLVEELERLRARVARLTEAESARDRAEGALLVSEEKYAQLFEHLVHGFAYHEIVLDDQGDPVDYVFLEANRAYERMTGLDREAIVGKRATEVIPGIERSAFDWVGKYGRVALTGKPLQFDQHAVLLGRWYTILAYSPRKGYFATLLHDITDRKSMMDTLSRYRLLSENTRDIILFLREDGRIFEANEAAVRAYGYPLDTLRLLSIDDLRAPGWKSPVTGGRRLASGEGVLIEARHRRADGSVFPVEIGIRSSGVGKDRVYLTIIRDITQRKQAEEALAREKEQLAVTLRSIGDGVITTDMEGRIVLMNDVASRMTGWDREEAAGVPLPEVFRIVRERTRQPCESPFDKVMATGGVVGMANHTLLIARDGTERAISDCGAPILDARGEIIGVVLVFRDVTEHRWMEEELFKARKLESVGLLAGGIAHDFNNILAAILGNISLAKIYVSPGEYVWERLEEAERASLRARDLTQQLLTFSKGGAPIRKTSSIVEAVRDSATFALRGSHAGCEFDFPDDLWNVEADEGQISQVIHNLVINADQAMPSGGTIRIRAENLTLGRKGPGSLPAGPYVRISVRDEGAGIPPENLPRIFDPYFTTKPDGSGLGLATSYSIARKHDGHLSAESSPGKGSVFHLYLPASPNASPPGGVRSSVASKAGKGRVLVMDDEDGVRDVMGGLLGHLGYEVEFAVDGAAAVERYREAREGSRPFDAVILDLTVPGGMGGREAMAKLKELDPGVKAIVSSGYSNDPVMAGYRDHGFRGVVAKPYKLGDLAALLDEVLGEDPATSPA